jgi:hypothetical protein
MNDIIQAWLHLKEPVVIKIDVTQLRGKLGVFGRATPAKTPP